MPVDKSSRIIVDNKFEPQNAEDVFYKYKAEMIEALRRNLEQADKDQPGRLIQSIDVVIEQKGAKLSFELSMEDYWKFVNDGVSGTEKSNSSQYKFKNDGKPVNIGAMMEFIKVRGIKPGSTRRKKLIKGLKNKTVKRALKQVTIEQAAIGMGIALKKKGIKPTKFYSSVVDSDFKARLKADLTKALKMDIEVNIKESIV